ncbi:MAG: molybdopterin-dependent oxidoreductase, partial [Pseudomonadota bacterium]|nr:molybdopterin-dependent oxidoreductase [Pseudomonadota bacterium]
MATDVRTTCPYCGVGCGLRVRVAGTAPEVRGDDRHPANRGRLCSKGAALAETLHLEQRLLYPEIRGRRVAWETALTAVAAGFREVIDRHGPEAVAFYVSGQLLTEDYYVANKLMKGFIGSANIDTNSRLCMASSVAGHKRAFGGDIVPCDYQDLEQAGLVVLVGSNLAWCHPELFQRLAAARQSRPNRRWVVIDPRRTATADAADLHLALRPGTDTALFNGLLAWLHRHGHIDAAFVVNHTEGYAAAVQAAAEVAPDIATTARRCGLGEDQVEQFFTLFAGTPRTVTLFSQGVNQASCGTDKVNAIINCHLATGRIGKPGAGPFSITGQPNAMGGREVGGLASQLAAHMDFTPQDIDRVRRFWNAPRMALRPGLKAVDLFRAVAEGQVKALWIMATNPLVSLPDADAVRAALQRCPLLVVSDIHRNADTLRYAQIRLPALGWGEKDGTVTNSERRISRQRAFLPPPGAARADWWMVCQVARRLCSGGFDYTNPAEIFREHARLSGFENHGSRAFDISGLADLSDADYDALAPVQWPVTGERRKRLLADGRFHTASGRAAFIAIGERSPANPVSETFPLVLNTGRTRDHWHTLTRTGHSPRLSAHVAEPYAELNPADALAWGIADQSLVQVSSRWGAAVVRARLNPGQQPGSVFVPMHWSGEFSSHGRIDPVVNPALDAVSGQPELKHTPVRLQPWRPAWHGFILSRRPLTIGEILADDDAWWVKVRGDGFWRYEIAGREHQDWPAWFRSLSGDDLEHVEYLDAAAGRYRGAALRDGGLLSCVFIAHGHPLPPRTWLAGLFQRNRLLPAERACLLAGRPAAGQTDQGRIICTCYAVGINTLINAIRDRQLTTAEQIGAVLQAGTHCGS